MQSILSIFAADASSTTTHIDDSCPNLSNFTQFVQDSQGFLLLLSHFEEIGWSNLRLLASSKDWLLTLHHVYVDMGDRLHDLYIDIPHRWPHERPHCRVTLPIDFTVEYWSAKTSRLIEIINHFHSIIDSLQPFWSQLADIERDAIVLDEQPISFASTSRRLKINEHVHIQIQIDPFHSSAFPVITFHGPSMLVRSFDERLESNRHHWNEAHSNIILNLEHILDLTFPTKFFFKPTSQTTDDHQQDCGICYESTLDAQGVVIYCETPNCYKQYHEKCWTSWLRKKVPQRGAGEILDIVVTDERLTTAASTMSGPCLFCKKMIIVH